MIYLTLIGSVIAGAFAVMKLDLGKPRRLKLVTAFTGAYLMALTCLHLIPEVFGNGPAHHHHGHHHGPSAITLGAFILIDFSCKCFWIIIPEALNTVTRTLLLGRCPWR